MGLFQSDVLKFYVTKIQKIAKAADYLEDHLWKGPVQTEVNCVFLQHTED